MNLKACLGCHQLVIALVIGAVGSMTSFANCDGRLVFTSDGCIRHRSGRFVLWQFHRAACVRVL